MPKKTLYPKNLKFQPRPTYPYSPDTQGGGMIFTAGQVAWDETGEVVGIGDVAEQTRQTIKNVVSVLEEGGATINDVLKCNVSLAHIRDFQFMNIEFSNVFHTAICSQTFHYSSSRNSQKKHILIVCSFY